MQLKKTNKMKNILKIIIILFIQNSFAQYPVLTTTSLAIDPNMDSNFTNNGNYAIDTNNERDQYVGLWRYQDNELLFELKMEKRDQFLFKIEYQGQVHYTYKDIIIFKYKLVKNGVLLYDNLETIIPTENYYSQATKHGNSDFLSGSMFDMTRNVSAVVSIKRLPTSNPDKIYFDLSSYNYSLRNSKEFYNNPPGIKLFNIPTDGIEMYRVN
jgi:hypothetical protein